MKQKLFTLLASTIAFTASFAQDSSSKKIYFVSDTQQPMFVEKLWLKPNHNIEATASIFKTILQEKPTALYMLGDVVGLGSSNHKWKKVDLFLDSCRSNGTGVCGVLGNHEVMGREKKGEANFQKRFPMNVKTGYVSVTDSVAVVLLNSNFSKLSNEDLKKERDWYKATLAALDTSSAVKAVIVCCHHAPFTNSTIVGSSQKVQEYFVGDYIKSKKAQLFITGHAHAFEHFNRLGKDFVVIGGGGGLHQPLKNKDKNLNDLSSTYKPPFHYLSVQRKGEQLFVSSRAINDDFKGFNTGYNFHTKLPSSNLAQIGQEELKKN